MVCHHPRTGLSLGCQAGKFLPRDGPLDWVGESVGLTRRRQNTKKDKTQIVRLYMTTGFLRNSIWRFIGTLRVHPEIVWVTIASLPRLRNCPWPQHAATLQVEVCLRLSCGGGEVGFFTVPQGG